MSGISKKGQYREQVRSRKEFKFGFGRVTVEVSRIISEIDAQIQKLQQARSLLAGTQAARTGPGRPKGSKNTATAIAQKPAANRKLSAEGRKRIADAMKKRWAERRKQATKG